MNILLLVLGILIGIFLCGRSSGYQPSSKTKKQKEKHFPKPPKGGSGESRKGVLIYPDDQMMVADFDKDNFPIGGTD